MGESNNVDRCNYCPYCGCLIEKTLTKIFECPLCQEIIYVERLGDESNLITQTDYEILETEKKRNERNRYYRFFEEHNLSISYLEQKERNWFSLSKGKATYLDLILCLSNEILQSYNREKKFLEMSMLYCEIALLKKRSNKDYFQLLKEAKKMELYHYKSILNKLTAKVEIIGGDKNCQLCKDLVGKRYSIKEALELMPIPIENCPRKIGLCTCSYAAADAKRQ